MSDHKIIKTLPKEYVIVVEDTAFSSTQCSYDSFGNEWVGFINTCASANIFVYKHWFQHTCTCVTVR